LLLAACRIRLRSPGQLVRTAHLSFQWCCKALAHVWQRHVNAVLPCTLQHAEERYGGMRGYMVRIGFSLEEQDSLCRSLTSDEW
jgi:hypothetical protein